MSKESNAKVFGVALALCVVCSVLVSGATVLLRPLQEKNKELDFKKNVLISASLLNKEESKNEVLVIEKFKNIRTILIDIATGDVIQDGNVNFDLKALLRDPKTTYNIPESEDIAKIKTRTLVSPVYLVQENGQTSKIIFPVYGKGLWSTMYGLLALGPDLNTVYGITYYEHGETPGLGGEIDNPKWQQGFVNKKLFKIESDGRLVPALTVIKGAVSSADGQADYKIDGLSGATMTSNGVTNSLTYWFGKNGFLPFVEKFKANGGQI